MTQAYVMSGAGAALLWFHGIEIGRAGVSVPGFLATLTAIGGLLYEWMRTYD